MNRSLEESYFLWLSGLVSDNKEGNPRKTHWKLFRKLHTKEFIWIIPNDDNRAEDGKDLRIEFADAHEIDLFDLDSMWLNMSCSMLELLIGLSRRLAFEAEGEPFGWFWELLENINLSNYNDNELFPHEEIDEILDEVIWRTYTKKGRGGLFPLKRTVKDQRVVELWYQLSEYVLEKGV